MAKHRIMRKQYLHRPQCNKSCALLTFTPSDAGLLKTARLNTFPRMNVNDFAELICVPHSSYSNYERGARVAINECLYKHFWAELGTAAPRELDPVPTKRGRLVRPRKQPAAEAPAPAASPERVNAVDGVDRNRVLFALYTAANTERGKGGTKHQKDRTPKIFTPMGAALMAMHLSAQVGKTMKLLRDVDLAVSNADATGLTHAAVDLTVSCVEVTGWLAMMVEQIEAELWLTSPATVDELGNIAAVWHKRHANLPSFSCDPLIMLTRLFNLGQENK